MEYFGNTSPVVLTIAEVEDLGMGICERGFVIVSLLPNRGVSQNCLLLNSIAAMTIDTMM
jgi:hypothetical protein